ncbi:MAG: biopolymer transporter ExbD [Deltaproteobacteria bacterium]|nr:MAG: biopolymer transporter ExbD [Deltaproteobacteria bacterium]
MKIATGRRADPLIDLTPMIDVVFQLVLFFMVSTTFKNAPAIQVDLPQSGPDVVVADSEDITLWVTVGGQVYLDQQPVDEEELRARLSQAGATRPETLVVLKADRGVAHGKVVAILDMARAYGLGRLAIATDPRVEPQSADQAR